MLNLISCELLKLKRSKMVLISVAGGLSTPILMLIEALQTHFDKPEIIFTLSDIYSDSVLYIMLLVNIMIYVAIAAYLFSREYTESTLKTILPIPISRTKLLIGKFCTLLLWIVMLTLVTWAGIFIVCGLYDAVFTLEGYSLLVAIVWLPKFLFGSILMFLTVSPFVFVAMKTKGFVAPMIGSAVIVMGSAALSLGKEAFRRKSAIPICALALVLCVFTDISNVVMIVAGVILALSIRAVKKTRGGQTA